MSTGSSRSAVTSEETDVGVMLKEMSTSQLLALGLAQSSIADARITSTICRWVGAGGGSDEAIGKFGFARFKMLCRSKKRPLSDWPKRRTGRLDMQNTKECRSKAYQVWTTHNIRDPEIKIDESRSTFQIDDSQIDIPDRHSRSTNPDRHSRLDRDR